MPLPASWVERIFQKLSLVYGRDFISRWEGQEMAAVMADWGHELDGWQHQPEAIRYALEHLPVDKPPTVLQFRALCNRRPEPTALAITNDVRAEPEKVAALAASITRAPQNDHRAWARALRDREQGGERLSMAQRDAWRTALKDAA